jgi:hypothetical protein
VNGNPGDLGDDAGPSTNDAGGGAASDARTEATVANDAGASDESTGASEGGDDAAPDAPGEAASEAGLKAHTVFVSSKLYDGNLGGLSGADSKCQALATAAGLTGTYKAWLSDSTTSAAYRLTHASAPYVLVDGTTVVAQNWNQLTSNGNLLHAIDKTESGGPPPVGTFQCGGSEPTVWTYTDPSGAPVGGGLDCSDWASSAVATAFTGVASGTDWPFWTQFCQSGPGASASTCADSAALYCMQQ